MTLSLGLTEVLAVCLCSSAGLIALFALGLLLVAFYRH
jgi:hypothetical protein